MGLARPEGRRDWSRSTGLSTIKPRQKMTAKVTYGDGTVKNVPILCRIDTLDELDYFKNGGILQYVLRDLAA